LWWRSKALDDGYVETRDRIIHAEIRKRSHVAGQRFFFQAGALDETSDRNGNGVIDSIDDTLDLLEELEQKGYQKGRDLMYLEIPDGRHDIATWARAFPDFLRFAFPLK
jgi:enterochelin esterase-like enzyme